MEQDVPSILHVDMDAFFAAVELRTRPELRGKPVIIGAGQRSVVLTATYEARPFGVRSGMPLATAQRMCPSAIVLAPSRGIYGEVSREVMAIFREMTPLVEQVSVDEAFLDVSGARRRLGTGEEIGRLIRRRVREEQDLACSVGVAANKSVAKIASERAKPDGMVVVRPSQTRDFLAPLPVSALWGVGGKTREALARLGIDTVGALVQTPEATLRRALGPALSQHLRALAVGEDPRPVTPGHTEKSLGAETTFARDLPRGPELDRELHALVDKAALRMRRQGLACQTVAIKVRTDDFATLSRSRTLPAHDDATPHLISVARELLAGVEIGAKLVRLVGVRLEKLAPVVDQGHQETFEEVDGSARAAEAAADRARGRFGSGAVRAASLLRREGEGTGAGAGAGAGADTSM
ncbi:MAG: DNA polymerase IV [Micrococcales bacterium]|nr:DNA polymerase IV [Micrococcales bacterium]